MTPSAPLTFPYQVLHTAVAAQFQQAGAPAHLAALAATNLLIADLRGIGSHGIARLPGYLRLVQAARVNLNTQGQCVRQTPGTATWDGEQGLGLVVGTAAMEKAISLAEQVGTGWVAVRNSNHFGIAGQYAMQAAKRGMIGFAFTNASPLVAPANGKDRMLGTNPIAVAIPAGEEPMFVLDMATTTAANGKLEVLQRLGKPAPLGWVQDADGEVSTAIDAVEKGGALRPLGGTAEGASYKGYGLGAVVDILSGVLSGAGYGPWVPPFVAFLPMPTNPVGPGIGHFFGAMRVDAFIEAAEFSQRMDHWIRSFRNSAALEGKSVLIPGDLERTAEEHNRANGLTITVAQAEMLGLG